MAGTFPSGVAIKYGIRRIFFPRPQQCARPRHAERIGAIIAAAAVAGIEKIKPFAASQNKRAFHHAAFPANVVADNFLRLANQFGAVRIEPLRPNGRRFLLAVAVFLPQQIADAICICERHRINRASRLRDQRAVIGVGAGWFCSGGHGDGQSSVALTSGVIDKKLSVKFRNFRRPKIPGGPVRPLRQHAAGLLPVHQVGGMEQRKQRPPRRRRAGGPIIFAHADDGRIGMIAGDDGIFVEHLGARKSRMETQRRDRKSFDEVHAVQATGKLSRQART